jgi:hypothetical protein
LLLPLAWELPATSAATPPERVCLSTKCEPWRYNLSCAKLHLKGESIMAIVYRPQRSEIRDGMAKLNAFDTIDELLAHVKQEWKSQYPDAKFKIKLKSLNDERTGWEYTRYVCMTDNGIDAPYRHPKVVGMCDSDTFKELSREDAFKQAKTLFDEWSAKQG